MGNIELEQGEQKIGTWTINYLPPGGGKYTGPLLVTNKRLLYEAKFDTSLKGFLEEAFFYKFGSEDFIVIPKERIKKVEVKKSFLSKKVLLTLDNGQEHTFDYGMLSVDKLAEAIQQKSL